MAPKNLLPVAALCSALVSGTPLAAWATPATANSLPQALNPVANSSGIVACQRFSLARATVRTSGCLQRNTVDSIVVDIKRPDKENGPQTGYAICTWKSAAVDADGDPCDLELRIDIDSVDDSANGAKVVFDSAAYEEGGGGVCLGCVPSNVDGAQPIISFTASLRLTKANTEAIATGDAPLLFYAGDADDQEAQGNRQKGSLNLTRGSESAPINIDTQEPGVQRILADPALLQMTWHGVGSVGIAAPISSDNDKSPKDEVTDAPPHVDDADDASSEDNAAAPLEKPGGTATELGDPQPKDGLDFAAPPDVDEGNCCMMVALDHTETVDAASIEPVAANAPRRKNILIAFPNTVELVFFLRVKSSRPRHLQQWEQGAHRTISKPSRHLMPQRPPSYTFIPLQQTEREPKNSTEPSFWFLVASVSKKTSPIKWNLKGSIVHEMPTSLPQPSSPRSTS